MLSYLSYMLTAVAALLVTCHGLHKCPGNPGLPGIPGLPGRDGLKGQPRLPDSLDTELHNVLVNLDHRLSRLEGVLALNGKIREVGEKILASNGKEVDFASALESCEQAGGTLATPMNEEENEAILEKRKYLEKYQYLLPQYPSSDALQHRLSCTE
ncbi:pulmonary surfactant-associated protein A-like [Ciconia boyciana]|uniref:pulmonary surfactant-associated protein A-like n=1 Tax=Ciconia boyciana TaxID=52775 RepID=UPI003B9DEABD